MFAKFLGTNKDRIGDRTKSGVLYSYEIKDLSGKIRKGDIKAFSLKEAVKILEKQSLAIISVEKAPYKEITRIGKIDHLSLMIIFKELSVMISSGLTIRRSLDILASQQNKPEIKNILDNLGRALDSGVCLSSAFSLFPEIFTRFHQGLIRAGETGGFLDTSLNYLAGTMEKEIFIKKKLKTALNYPIMVFMVGFVFILCAFYWSLPYVRMLVNDLHIALPLPTRILLTIAQATTEYYVALPLFFIILTVIVKWPIISERYIKNNLGLEKITMATPLLRDIMKKSLISQTFIVLEALIASGINVVNAINLAGEICENAIFGNALKEVSEEIKKGKTLGEALESFPQLFPKTVTSMVTVGEATGELVEIFNKIILLFTLELDSTVENITKLVEPVAIIVMGVIIGVIVLLFFMPIYIALSQAL